MFIFSWFDLFGNAYRNGLADGFSLALIFNCALLFAVFKYRFCYLCDVFHILFRELVSGIEDGSVTAAEIRSFKLFMLPAFFLPDSLKREILAAIAPAEKFAGFRSSSNSRKMKDELPQLRQIIRSGQLDTASLFFAAPVKNLFDGLGKLGIFLNG